MINCRLCHRLMGLQDSSSFEFFTDYTKLAEMLEVITSLGVQQLTN